MAGQEPAADYSAMLEIAQRRAPEHIRDALSMAEPVGKTAHYRTPSSRWRRYDKLVRFPEASWSPVTRCAASTRSTAKACPLPLWMPSHCDAACAAAIRICPGRFFRASAKTVNLAWRNAVSADLSLPEVAGHRSIGMRLNSAFAERVLTAVETDPVVAGQFFRVLGMLDSPARLMRPSILARVCTCQSRTGTACSAAGTIAGLLAVEAADQPRRRLQPERRVDQFADLVPVDLAGVEVQPQPAERAEIGRVEEPGVLL